MLRTFPGLPTPDVGGRASASARLAVYSPTRITLLPCLPATSIARSFAVRQITIFSRSANTGGVNRLFSNRTQLQTQLLGVTPAGQIAGQLGLVEDVPDAVRSSRPDRAASSAGSVYEIAVVLAALLKQHAINRALAYAASARHTVYPIGVTVAVRAQLQRVSGHFRLRPVSRSVAVMMPVLLTFP